MLITRKEFEDCEQMWGHTYDFCYCQAYLLQQEILRLRKALQWYADGMPWNDSYSNALDCAIKALKINVLD